jgi:preprotein translocase subunit SecF
VRTSAPHFRINNHSRLAWLGSGLAIAISLLGLLLCWLNPSIGAPLRPGLDFTGGTQIQVERTCGTDCPPITSDEVRATVTPLTLPAEGQDRPPNLAGTTVQVLDGGGTLLLRLPVLNPDQSQFLLNSLETSYGPLITSGSSVDTIGPTLGSRILRSSMISLLVSFIAISAYISFRYSGIFAILALVCLAHDVLITCGVFAWLGLGLGIEVDALFAVALVTVAGYSINDTVVVYDRIREQKQTLPDLPFSDQVDIAVDATLTRSLYTSFTTLLPLLGVILLGGSSLFWFAVALAIGVAVGSWSSIGVAPTLLVAARR